MKFEAAVESNGGDATTKAKALVLALKGRFSIGMQTYRRGT
jgi:hypothetical protein